MNAHNEKFHKNAVIQASKLVEKKDLFKLALITGAQITMGFLDLFGIIIIGWIGALAVQGFGVTSTESKMTLFLRIFGLENWTFQNQIALLSILSGSILILKTFFSIVVTKRTFRFLAKKSVEVSAEILSKFTSQDLLGIQKKSSQQILYIVSTGIENIMTGILATTITIVSDCSLLLIIMLGLFILDPVIALGSLFLFGCVGYLLHKMMSQRSKQIGKELNTRIVTSNELILELLNTYRESLVRNRRTYYVNEIRNSRTELEKLNAELSFQPFISKYVIESVIVVGTLAMASYQFLTKDAVGAISLLIVFAAATTRIAPAVLRIQQAFLTLRSCAGSAASTFEIIDELREIPEISGENLQIDFTYEKFDPSITLSQVKFKYPTRSKFELKVEELSISSGTKIAVVGPSGSGKTTLIDLILGVLEPNSGKITISGMPPKETFKQWPGSVSYVAQNTVIVSGSVRKNVGLGYPEILQTDKRIWETLATAQIESTVRSLPFSLESDVGESGNLLSGGQRQRLGIARALFTSPKLLVLDEATSALDGLTEAELSKALDNLSGHVTVLVVAHRLSTIRNADKIIYVEGGEIRASGTFDEIILRIPEFATQFKIM